jgi:hypothetical protein
LFTRSDLGLLMVTEALTIWLKNNDSAKMTAGTLTLFSISNNFSFFLIIINNCVLFYLCLIISNKFRQRFINIYLPLSSARYATTNRNSSYESYWFRLPYSNLIIVISWIYCDANSWYLNSCFDSSSDIHSRKKNLIIEHKLFLLPVFDIISTSPLTW